MLYMTHICRSTVLFFNMRGSIVSSENFASDHYQYENSIASAEQIDKLKAFLKLFDVMLDTKVPLQHV